MITNKTKKKNIVKNTVICKNIFSKTKGLMFSKRLKDKALIFLFDKEKIIPLHMFFVFQTIDVLFINKNKKVVEIKQNFKPFTFYTNKNKASYIIELPEKSIEKAKIKTGDIISF